MNTFKNLSEAFAIFAKYDEGEYKTCAEHDIIYGLHFLEKHIT